MHGTVRNRSPFRQGLWSVGFVLTLLAVSVLAAHGYRTARSAELAREHADRSGRILQAAQELETHATRMEANQRGYLVAGEPRLQRARDADYRQALAALARLHAPISDDPTRTQRLRGAERALHLRYRQMLETGTVAAEQGLDAARAHFAERDPAGFEPVRQRLAALRNDEGQRLVAHSMEAAERARRFNQALAFGAIALLLLLLDSGVTLLVQRRRGAALGGALERSNAMQRAILESAGSMVIATDPDGVITVFNHAATQALGYSPEEVIGRQQPLLFHLQEEVRAHAEMLGRELHVVVEPGMDALVALARRGMTDLGRWTFVRRDGSQFRVELAVSAARGPEGQLLGFVGIARDVTEHERAHERLRQSEQRVRTVIETASDAFIAIDADGIIQDWNVKAERMMGWTRDEAIGRRLAELVIPPQHRHAHERGLQRYVETGQGPILNRRIEISALHRSGHEFPVELTVWPLQWEGATRFNAFMHDITERKAAENHIRELNAELTAQADQLTQTNRELESFSYSVSHDLRAPLRHMSGYAQMLREDATERLDAAMLRYIDEIAASARRMGGLIDDLLAFSRLNRQALTFIPFDMNVVVADAMNEAGSAQNPQARIEVAPLPRAYGDPVLLKQVWVNLISNAIKYSAPRGADALIRIEGHDGEDRVRYRIRDNGVGFDPRYADKLFGVFQRLHSQEEFEGTGVGLAIVQRIVARHRGHVAANAEPGHGAEFAFELPLQVTKEAAA